MFYGWWIVAAGFLIQGLNGGLLFHGFTVYFLPLQSEFGWSRALVAAGISLTRFESAILGPIQGWAIDRYGPRLIVLGGMVLFGAGFIVLGYIQSVFMYFVAFTFLALGSSLGGFLAITAALTNWFARKRAMAMGVAMTGMGVGGLIVPGLAWSIATYGWRPTAIASGLVVWIVGIPVSLLLRHKPESYGFLPDGRVQGPPETQTDGDHVDSLPSNHDVTPDPGFSARDALRTPAFWLISFGHASALLVVATVSIHQVPHMVQQVGLSLSAAGWFVALLMGMTIVGQLGGGYLADRVNKQAVLVACMLGHCAGLLMLAYASNVGHLVAFTALHGLSWGARGPTQQALRADYFGRGSFATIMGFSSLVIMIAMMIAPIFAGWVADQRGGDYTPAFAILAVLAGLGSVFFIFARKPTARPGHVVQEHTIG